jgi:hypothetical protein
MDDKHLILTKRVFKSQNGLWGEVDTMDDDVCEFC